MGLDVTGAGGTRLHLFLLLFPQDSFSQEEVSSSDVVVLVGLKGSGARKTEQRKWTS